MAVHLDPDELRPGVTRVKLARGQLDAVIRMLEDGQDCERTVTQIAAVSKAVDRAGYAVIATGMRACFASDPTGETVDAARLEKMFLTLS